MHSHLSFLQHGEGRVAFLGGDNGEVVEREPLEVDVIVMQANVVTYLQSLTSQQKVSGSLTTILTTCCLLFMTTLITGSCG